MLSVLRQQLSDLLLPSNKTVHKIIMMAMLAFLAFGITGLGVFTLMYSLSTMRAGRDSAASHGISASDSSRLGGAAIALIFGAYFIGLVLLTPYTPSVVRVEREMYLWLAILICVFLGLAEDIKADFLTPFLRLMTKFAVWGWFFWLWPDVIPKQLGIMGLDDLLQVPLLAWLLTTTFCVGFINAFNMADGANGLVPGIAFAAFVIFFLEYGRPIDGILMFACTMFLLFNIISGWFFLGDTGSYGLGAIILGYGLIGVIEGDFSIWFMLALAAYPCLDFVASITRRLASGRSPFVADDGHLHNYLHRKLKPVFSSKVMANSITGLLISGCTAGLALLGYITSWRAADSPDWLWVFVAEAGLYLLVMRWLKQQSQQEG